MKNEMKITTNDFELCSYKCIKSKSHNTFLICFYKSMATQHGVWKIFIKNVVWYITVCTNREKKKLYV